MVSKVTKKYKVGDHVCALYYGPRRDKHPRWVPAVVRKAMGTRCFNVQVTPHGPVWRRHWEQLQPKYSSTEDCDNKTLLLSNERQILVGEVLCTNIDSLLSPE